MHHYLNTPKTYAMDPRLPAKRNFNYGFSFQGGTPINLVVTFISIDGSTTGFVSTLALKHLILNAPVFLIQSSMNIPPVGRRLLVIKRGLRGRAM